MKKETKVESDNNYEVPLSLHQRSFCFPYNSQQRLKLIRKKRQRGKLPGRIASRPKPAVKDDSLSKLQQKPLPFPSKFNQDETRNLHNRIAAHMQGKLDLTITDNRSSIISVKKIKGVHKVRIHHMFIKGDFFTIKALARYIENADEASSEILEEYIDRNEYMIREAPPVKSKPAIRTQGNYHNLQKLFNKLNKKYFNNKIKAKITWGRILSGIPRHHKTVKMGTYSVEDKIIRIHCSLDRKFVPDFFIESIIYHEMLHQVFGAPEVNGRRRYHTQEFHQAERKYEFFIKAKRWEKENITRLLYF
ncbi:MAG: hypothetical protein ACQES9_12305 [Myxococcota bacterium]